LTSWVSGCAVEEFFVLPRRIGHSTTRTQAFDLRDGREVVIIFGVSSWLAHLGIWRVMSPYWADGPWLSWNVSQGADFLA